MRCELCNNSILPGEIVHGIRYGSLDQEHQLFLPNKESAITVICALCGEKIYRQIYSRLNTSIDPTIYKTFMQTR